MKPANKILIVPLICSMVAFAGCVSQKQNMIDQGYPLAYANGFDVDRQYAQGWSDGFRQCETEQEAMQRQIRMGLEQQQFMELKKHNDWEEQRHLESELLRGIDTSGLKNLKYQ